MTTRFDELSQRLTAQADLLYMISDELDELNDLAQQKDLSSEELLDAGASFLTLAEMIDSIEPVSKGDLHDMSDILRRAIIIAGELASGPVDTEEVVKTVTPLMSSTKPELPSIDSMTPEQIEKEIIETLTAMLKGGGIEPPFLTTAIDGTKSQPGWPLSVHIDVAQFPYPEKLAEAMKLSVLARVSDANIGDFGNLGEVIQLRDQYLSENNINPYSGSLILMALISMTMHKDDDLQCIHCVMEKILEMAKLGDQEACNGYVMTLWGHLLTRTKYAYFDRPASCKDMSREEMYAVKLSFFGDNIEDAAQALIFNLSPGIFSTPPILDRALLKNFFDVPL